MRKRPPDLLSGDLFAEPRPKKKAPTVRQRIDAAMQPAVEHADAKLPGWSDVALEHVRAYALRHETFIAEDVRLVAEASGFEVPPSRRAWGAVLVRAARAGYLRKDGFAMSTAPTANPTPVTKWRSLIELRPAFA